MQRLGRQSEYTHGISSPYPIYMLSASVEMLPQFKPLWTVILVNTDVVFTCNVVQSSINKLCH